MKILILSSDPLSLKVGGIGLRYRRLIEFFLQKMEVLAWAPETIEGLPEEVVRWNGKSLVGVDFVIAPPMALLAFPVILASDVFLFVDLIDPLILENAFLYPKDELRLRAYSNLLLLSLWRGDHFIVAHSRQRDLWMGMMLGTRRLDSKTLAADSVLSRVFTEFPTPAPDGPNPGRQHRGHTVLWWGGLWDWLDPLTLVEAFQALGRDGPDKLVFVGLRHPSGNVPVSRAAHEIQKMADRKLPHGKTIEAVDWIPYEERWKYLKDACVGVSLHRDTLESKFAYRTRLLDLLWAGVPLITTEGEFLGDLASRFEAGMNVPPGSPTAVANALRKIWESPEAAQKMSAAAQRLAESLSWARRGPEFCEHIRDVYRCGLFLRRPHPKTLYRKYLEVRADFKRIGSLSHRIKTAISREGFWNLFRRT